VIGTCGHQCEGWGAVHELGEPLPWVPCPACAAKEAGIEEWPYWEPIPRGVWVRVAPKDAKKQQRKEAAKKKAPPRKAATPKRAWEVFLND
jgi:hypothetical protein